MVGALLNATDELGVEMTEGQKDALTSALFDSTTSALVENAEGYGDAVDYGEFAGKMLAVAQENGLSASEALSIISGVYMESSVELEADDMKQAMELYKEAIADLPADEQADAIGQLDDLQKDMYTQFYELVPDDLQAEAASQFNDEVATYTDLEGFDPTSFDADAYVEQLEALNCEEGSYPFDDNGTLVCKTTEDIAKAVDTWSELLNTVDVTDTAQYTAKELCEGSNGVFTEGATDEDEDTCVKPSTEEPMSFTALCTYAEGTYADADPADETSVASCTKDEMPYTAGTLCVSGYVSGSYSDDTGLCTLPGTDLPLKDLCSAKDADNAVFDASTGICHVLPAATALRLRR